MDQLAFRYMEMCKVESSTDSDSEISPRWSDTSTMGCVSSTPESGTFKWTLPSIRKPAGRRGSYSVFLDPYDGSSEDSDESTVNVGVSSRRTRQQGEGLRGGGCQFPGRGGRFILQHPVSFRDVVKTGLSDHVMEQQHVVDVQMKCGSDSEMWLCELDVLPSSHCAGDGCRDLQEATTSDSIMHAQTMDIKVHWQFANADLQATRSPTPQTPEPVTAREERNLSPMLDSSSERSPSPSNLFFYKRKLGFTGAEVAELGQRKRQCVVSMEDEQKGGGVFI
ncbi:uncharacterized protein V6R79_014440 [Siganus canaliculatus]